MTAFSAGRRGLVAALASLVLATPAAVADQATAPQRDGFEELLLVEAREAMWSGDQIRTWHFYWRLLKLQPDDVEALRESGRAAHALGEFGYAERALGRAAELTAGKPDPELHFLRAESLRALGRDREAKAEFAKAERDIGEDPEDRRSCLWLGRIYAVRGQLDKARALYEKQLWKDDRRQEHSEILMYLVEAHILADDWAGAERILRQYLSYWPGDERPKEMLAWVLEARGDIEAELTVRRTLLSAPEVQRDRVLAYARTLERAHDYPAALAYYREVKDLGVADVAADIDRMELRLAPEVMTAMTVRSDPSGSMLGWQGGATMSFGSRRRLILTGAHEIASPPDLPGLPAMDDVSVSAVNARAVYTRPTGGVFSLGATAYTGANADVRLGGLAAMRVRPIRPIQLHVAAEANQSWRESASTLREDGVVDSVTAEVYSAPFSDRVIFGVTGRVRRLGLEAMAGAPRAHQLFGAAGLDLVLSASPGDAARGEMFDHDLLWPSGMAPSVVLSLRHYELESDSPFGSRLVLIERSRLDEVSAVGRKVLGDGVFGAEARGGLGYDWIRQVQLWRAGASVLVAVTPTSRFTFDFDIASESATGLAGRRHAGVMGLHVDL
jgi:tetratricopeptide (TPR) repeat protein